MAEPARLAQSDMSSSPAPKEKFSILSDVKKPAGESALCERYHPSRIQRRGSLQALLAACRRSTRPTPAIW